MRRFFGAILMWQIEGAQNKPGNIQGYNAVGLCVKHCIYNALHSTGGYTQRTAQVVAHTLHTLYTRCTQRTQRHTYTCIAKVGTHKYTHLC